MPIAASFDTILLELTVTFDQALQPGFSNMGNWRLRQGVGIFKAGAGAGTIAGNTVVTPLAPSGGFPGALNSHDFLDLITDVFNLFGQPLAAYSDFPTVSV